MKGDDEMFEHEMSTPLGTLRLRATEAAITGVYFAAHKGAPPRSDQAGGHLAVVREAERQLRAYFAGELWAFDVPCAASGSPIEEAVWRALRDIPCGQTETYGGLASRVGRPGAARAIGGANARNPLSIIVPCHRVIASSGALTGYAGGVEAKRWLLAHEARASAGRHADVRSVTARAAPPSA